MDKVKQALKGRSGTIENGIDSVVGRLGKYGETLKTKAEGLKTRVRDLDEDRKPGSGTSPTADASPTAGTSPTADAGPSTGTSTLRGDLAGPTPPEAPER